MSDDGVLDAVAAQLAEHFGHLAVRASISFVGVDPIEVLRFEPVPGERAYVTLGMSRQPMSGSEVVHVDAAGPRGELLLQVQESIDRPVDDVWRRLAVLGAAPAVEGVVYAPGMSLDLGTPLVAGSACTGVLVGESAIAELASSAGPVTVFEVIPATSTELAWCRVRGQAALRQRWREHCTELTDLWRAPVLLG